MTSNTKWPSGPSMTKFYNHVLANSSRILHGTMLVIDPGSKQPGFAYFYHSRLQIKGTVDINTKLKVNERLHQIYDKLALLPTPELLVVEQIRGKMAKAELLYSVGTALTAVRSPIAIEIPITVWRTFAGKEYCAAKKRGETSDADDAEIMGNALIEYVKEFST